jgi:hypothetical protein
VCAQGGESGWDTDGWRQDEHEVQVVGEKSICVFWCGDPLDDTCDCYWFEVGATKGIEEGGWGCRGKERDERDERGCYCNHFFNETFEKLSKTQNV